MSDIITDEQIERAARYMTVNPSCCVVRGYGPETPQGCTTITCGATLHYANGKTRIKGHCGEACEFVRKTLGEFSDNTWRVKHVLDALRYTEKFK